MKYGMLLWPHANSRYREAVGRLAINEMVLLARSVDARVEPRDENIAGVEFLCFESDVPRDDLAAAVKRHALMYLWAEIEPDGRLNPICGQPDAFLNWDLNGILKYKGKTNEAFTRSLLNFALCSGAFAKQTDDFLSVLDPMCGRGTTLFEAVNRGFAATGIDLSAADVREGAQYFGKYLEYHRLKHRVTDESLTLPGKMSARVKTFDFANTQGAPRERGRLSFITQDACAALRALSANSFHAAACDLPYGVQHAPGGKNSFEEMIARLLPEVRRVLKPGGAIALSYNTHTLSTDRLRALFSDCGLAPLSGGPYEGNAHWVEQAIVRDLTVGVKEK